MATNNPDGGLLDRLRAGSVICAEGYLFEFERRGYLQAGAFVPEVVLEHPELVAGLHREFVHAGLGRGRGLHLLRTPREAAPDRQGGTCSSRSTATRSRSPSSVARETGTLAAGNLCNTNVFRPDDEARRQVRAMFDEQLGVDRRGGRRLRDRGDLQLRRGGGDRARGDPRHRPARGRHARRPPCARRRATGAPPREACARLADRGADVVGLNCIRGPRTMLPLIREIRAATDAHVAALPVPYRTTAGGAELPVAHRPGL